MRRQRITEDKHARMNRLAERLVIAIRKAGPMTDAEVSKITGLHASALSQILSAFSGSKFVVANGKWTAP